MKQILQAMAMTVFCFVSLSEFCVFLAVDQSFQHISLSAVISSMSQSSSQVEKFGHSLQNGQKVPPVLAKSSTPVKKQQELPADGSKPPGGRRCVRENKASV